MCYLCFLILNHNRAFIRLIYFVSWLNCQLCCYAITLYVKKYNKKKQKQQSESLSKSFCANNNLVLIYHVVKAIKIEVLNECFYSRKYNKNNKRTKLLKKC